MVGVCIKYFHENYGGMLQAYATISMLEERNIQYELIQYKKKYSIIGMLKSVPRLFNGVLLNDKYEAFLKNKGKKKHLDFAENDNVRKQAFEVFRTRHFTKLSPVFTGYNELKSGAQRYSAVITGSDQLWSPAGLPTNYYNLMFVPDNIKKISYASSFGVKNIPWYQKNRTAKFLNRIEYISMRENRGSEIVKELTGKSVPTILDPVFMFDKLGWENLVPENREIEDPYIFAYFLGNNTEHRKVVKAVAQKFGCKIVTLRHLDQYVEADEDFGDIAPYDVGPDRFLNFIRNAKYVCTDSFHGACFSIIHKKQFIVFNRYGENSKYSKNSRIDTLCNNLGLQNRRYEKENDLGTQLEQKIHYEEVEIKLANLKEKTNVYLNEAFKYLE